RAKSSSPRRGSSRHRRANREMTSEALRLGSVRSSVLSRAGRLPLRPRRLRGSRRMEVHVSINGAATTHDIQPRVLLADYIRTRAGLAGTHIGCDTTSCGACTVLLDGKPVKSCTMLAVQADGHEVTTVEGLKSNGALHPIQAAFKEEHGLQCGFCT